MTLLQLFAISGLINFVFSLSWGLFVLFKNFKEKVNILFFILILATSLWSFGYYKWIFSNFKEEALFWVRIFSIGSTLIPIFYFHWLLNFLNRKSKVYSFILILGYLLTFLLLLFSFTDLYVKDVRRKLFFPFWPDPGILYSVYIIFLYTGIILISLLILLREYLKFNGLYKNPNLIILFITTLVTFGGGFTNFPLWYDIPILPFGNFFVALFPIIFGYATLKFKFFNIRVLAVELFVYIVFIFYLIQALTYTTILELFFNILIFLGIFIGGILLIRGVIKEVEQKEKLEILTQELERLNKLKTEFLSIASHQIRSPMANIKGFVDLLINNTYGQLPEKAIETLKKIMKNIDEEIKLVNDLLDLRKIEEGRMEYEFVNFNINEMIKTSVEFYKIMAKEKGLEIKYNFPEYQIVIKGDPEKLTQVVNNLIDNAIKYTNEGYIEVNIQVKNNSIIIIVKDTGRGIMKENLESIFQEFTRDEKVKHIIIGSGLGLYIAKKIIEAHQGKIWAESEGIGKGSTFYIELPIDPSLKIS